MVRHTHAKLQEYTIERKENWKAMLNGMIKSVGDSNEDLTIALEKLCNSKKVPRRWIKLNKPKFENFLKYLRYKIDPKVANQMWEMFSKALEAEKKKEEKKKIPKITEKTASEEKWKIDIPCEDPVTGNNKMNRKLKKLFPNKFFFLNSV